MCSYDGVHQACRMDKVKITSLEAETTQEHDMETVMGALAESYSSVFGYDDVLVADVPADAVGQFVTEIVTEIAEGHADHDDS